MIAAARAHLPPELYNRMDEVLCFGPLARAEVAEIARRLLAGLAATLEARGIRLDVEPARHRGAPRRAAASTPRSAPAR